MTYSIDSTKNQTVPPLTEPLTAQNIPKPHKNKRKQPKTKVISKKKKLLARAGELLSGKSVRQLAIDVGYSPNSRKMYESDITEQLAEVFDVSDAEVRKEFKLLLDDCKQTNDRTNRARTIESLARIKGMFKDKQEITHKDDVDPNMTPDKLNELILTEAKSITDKKDSNGMSQEHPKDIATKDMTEDNVGDNQV